MSDHTAGGHLAVPRSDHASRRHDAEQLYVNAQDSLSCTETHRKGRSFILSLRLAMGKNGHFRNAFANCSEAFKNRRGHSLRGASGSSSLYGKFGGFDNRIKNKANLCADEMELDQGLQARQSVSTFAKCLLVSVLPKPLPERMVPHAAAHFCETLPSSPDSPVRNGLLLLGSVSRIRRTFSRILKASAFPPDPVCNLHKARSFPIGDFRIMRSEQPGLLDDSWCFVS